MPFPGADSIISSYCRAISGFPGEERRRCGDMRAACRSSPRPPDERRREYSGRRSCRSPYQILGVQGCRGHTISGREFNLFKPLRRRFRASADPPSSNPPERPMGWARATSRAFDAFHSLPKSSDPGLFSFQSLPNASSGPSKPFLFLPFPSANRAFSSACGRVRPKNNSQAGCQSCVAHFTALIPRRPLPSAMDLEGCSLAAADALAPSASSAPALRDARLAGSLRREGARAKGTRFASYRASPLCRQGRAPMPATETPRSK